MPIIIVIIINIIIILKKSTKWKSTMTDTNKKES